MMHLETDIDKKILWSHNRTIQPKRYGKSFDLMKLHQQFSKSLIPKRTLSTQFIFNHEMCAFLLTIEFTIKERNNIANAQHSQDEKKSCKTHQFAGKKHV